MALIPVLIRNQILIFIFLIFVPKLSKTLEAYPQFFDENKISIVQKSVNKIDLLPKEYHQIETLYLSNNNLETLDGIEQFPNLKTLTLVNNEVYFYFHKEHLI